MWETLATVRDLGRVQEIASVLVRYGFGDVVQRIGMAGALERAGRLLHIGGGEASALRLSPPERVRHALQDLGPTFVKLGQVLATRVDLLPPEWIEELGRLQSHVPAVPMEALRAQLEEDLGDAPERVFARFEDVPMAAASLAQAHRAWLHDGTPVVLKIRRPGIREIIEADLRLLARLAEIVQSQAPDLRRYRPVEVVRQFDASLRRELDFARECRNAERIAGNFAEDPRVLIPHVYWEWTSERLNVQALVDGIPAGDFAAIDTAGLDRHALASTGADIVMQMVFEDGLFHADPHPGNLFFMRDGRVALIDFGMVGRVSPTLREQVARLLYGLVFQQPQMVCDVLLDWTEGADVDEMRLQSEIDAFVDQYRGVLLKDLRMGAMLGDVTGLLRRHGLMLPPDLALLIKALLTLEGLGRQLDPDFDMTGAAQPWLQRLMWQRHSPRALAQRGQQSLSGALDLLTDLPRDLRRLVQSARRGRLRGQIEVTSLKAFGDQVNSAANRMTMGVIVAALIIGSSIVMNAVSNGPGNPWLMALGVIGFIGAALGGVWILLSIWRSGRRR
ncbi:ubiquinone biosynthesis protein UbiB [Lysobacteraceae bacterium NML93-0792]|nr:ubiquinone biosynthesis protein UbiB [Xanthomonadaceae bacterium NML93-0792]PBS16424.1 ubiquinone biosynthesis protein UbiB [Xanthomonadaceae bacterium NML93-0793]PBS19233.1 ubiquinone biosynthesis protein UbiB [Xanthomonadaceae bacterium NML93-0831]